MNDDEYSTREFIYYARKIAFCKDATYIYYQLDESLTKKHSPRKFNVYRVFMRLEELAKKEKMKKSLIKTINKHRYSEFYYLQNMYLQDQDKFSLEDQKTIQGYLDEHFASLKPYYTLADYIFRKERIMNKKFIVLFHFIKFQYRKLKNA
ncbi:hypothetical protein [Campylobacter sp. MIT 99-7217]|uniref:hypothetical protein n=1 Tax=Campylobacter sp. MIT 99-7217 TaxID=535091 RepID=UPI00163C2F09|nr:hypothetical protein [Campylobacter sp. MIT 99-7217]